MKKCCICKIKKDLSCFHIKSDSPDKKDYRCKECKSKIYSSEEYKKKRNAQMRYTRKTNGDKIRTYHREYRRKPEMIKYTRDYCKYWQREKSKNPKHRIDRNMRSMVWRALKGKKVGRKWEALVGYTLEDLMKHLEAQFENWMTWDNWGIVGSGKRVWNIDHKKPKSLFSFETPEDLEFKKCWALRNLQPLEGIENIRKGNKILL